MNSQIYQARVRAETRNYTNCLQVEDLPPIFHYWSNRFVRPRLEQFGFSSPTGMIGKYVEEQSSLTHGGELRLLSIGTGNCELEIDLASRLRAGGREVFVIDCLEFNPAMLERARVGAAQSGVEEHINLVQADFNQWTATHAYDAVIASQALHHVLHLEHLLAEVKTALKPRGRFIISDMIGRNGHQFWPEALDILHEFWRKLPPSYRFNEQLNRYEEMYINEDCSRESFEAIRSQDILPLLLERFHFEVFIGFANIINPFVDRSFGPHFDVAAPWDRNFIDEVHARDEREILSGRIQPTHMLAVMGNVGGASCVVQGHLTPEFCVHSPREPAQSPSERASYEWGAWPHSSESELEIACRRLSAAARQIEAAKKQLEDSQLDLEKRTSWAWQCENERDQRSAWAIQVNQENAALAAQVSQLEADLKDRTAWALQLDKDFEERTNWATQLQKELEEQTAARLQLNKEFEERTQWALQLHKELEERTAWALQLNQELESTAWLRSLKRNLGKLIRR